MAAGNGKRSLEEIFEEHLAVTKAGFELLRTEFRTEFGALRKDMNDGFAGTSWDDHETRIAALESDVAKLKAG